VSNSRDMRGWRLVDKTGKQYRIGDAVATIEREGYPPRSGIIDGLEPPHKPEASGRVYFTPDGQFHQVGYYAQAFGLKFQKVE
jgi:hypothetical protein